MATENSTVTPIPTRRRASGAKHAKSASEAHGELRENLALLSAVADVWAAATERVGEDERCPHLLRDGTPYVLARFFDEQLAGAIDLNERIGSSTFSGNEP